MRKGTLWELRKVSTVVSLRSPRRLTTVETFRYWQIFCVLSDKPIFFPRIDNNHCDRIYSSLTTESCFRHPLFDLRGSRKVEIRHTNFHFSSKKVTSKSRKVEVFDLTIVKKLSTFRPKKAKVEKLKS